MSGRKESFMPCILARLHKIVNLKLDIFYGGML